MRPPDIIRIAVPRREPASPPPRRHAARELLEFLSRCENLLAGTAQDPKAPQAAALRVLAALPPRTSRLARDLTGDLGMDGGQLSRILSGLEERGLISRSAAADKRLAPISLTALGRLALRRQRQDRMEAATRLLSALPETRRNSLAESLAKASAVLKELSKR